MPASMRGLIGSYYKLSLKDLLEARSLQHVRLMNTKNVVATAIGLHRFRDEEKPTFGKDGSIQYCDREIDTPRTLGNSRVYDYSWPSILVFVNEWQAKKDLSKVDTIPDRLDLPGGKSVPVCVVYIEPSTNEPAGASPRYFKPNNYGLGHPITGKIQGREYEASIGCLVTDGRRTYALTSNHVCGSIDQDLFSGISGRRIGKASEKQIDCMEFERVYPGLPCKDTCLHLDVGLIDIDDITYWNTQIGDMGSMGEMLDLSDDAPLLDLIGTEVMAYGGISGKMEGEIAALFYRYQSMGGIEYIADILIGPRKSIASLGTRHGDSGTMWVVQSPEKDNDILHPIAVQWGGQILGSDQGQARSYALATFLSTTCNLLGVSPVAIKEPPEYLGWRGHLSFADYAVSALGNDDLRNMLNRNWRHISRPIESTGKGPKNEDLNDYPLCDIPDDAWKPQSSNKKVSFKNQFVRPEERHNHYINLDRPVGKKKLTLKEYIERRDGKVTPAVLLEFYGEKPYYEADSIGRDKVVEKNMPIGIGALPLRIYQVYEYMTTAETAAQFICGAGILTHYVADASTPGHLTYFFVDDNMNDRPKDKLKMIFDDGMFDNDNKCEDIRLAMEQAIDERGGGNLEQINDMFIKVLSTMLENYNNIYDINDFSGNLWDKYSPGVKKSLSDGVLLLAGLWEKAWRENKNSSNWRDTGDVGAGALKTVWSDRAIMPSAVLDWAASEFTKRADVSKNGDGRASSSTKRRTSAKPKSQ